MSCRCGTNRNLQLFVSTRGLARKKDFNREKL